MTRIMYSVPGIPPEFPVPWPKPEAAPLASVIKRSEEV